MNRIMLLVGIGNYDHFCIHPATQILQIPSIPASYKPPNPENPENPLNPGALVGMWGNTRNVSMDDRLWNSTISHTKLMVVR
jgi:hypothetical protein